MLAVIVKCIFGFTLLWAQMPDLSDYEGRYALEETVDSNGSLATIYVKIMKQDKNRLTKGGTKVAVNYSPKNQKERVKGLSTGPHAAQRGSITLPVESLTLDLQGISREIIKGTIILAHNNEMYIVEDVYPDDRLATSRVYVNPGSRNSIGNFARPHLPKENIVVLESRDVRAVQVESFRGYVKNGAYERIEGIPVCDKAQLEFYAEENPLRINFTKYHCSNGVMPIHGVFSDGSLAVGTSMRTGSSKMFNPFPEIIGRYKTAEEFISY